MPTEWQSPIDRYLAAHQSGGGGTALAAGTPPPPTGAGGAAPNTGDLLPTQYPGIFLNPYTGAVVDLTGYGQGGGTGGGMTAYQGAQLAQSQSAQSAQQQQQAAQLALQQQQAQRDYEMAQANLQEQIRQREQQLTIAREHEAAETGRQREQWAAERQRLEMQLQFDREQLAENKRQYDKTFGEGQRQFGLTFGEGQREFDITQGQNYLRTAVETFGNDPGRQAAYLFGERGGMTPIEGALRAFKPVGVKAAATGAKNPKGNLLVGEGQHGEGLRAGTAELIEVDQKTGKVKRITPIEGAYASGFVPIGDTLGGGVAAPPILPPGPVPIQPVVMPPGAHVPPVYSPGTPVLPQSYAPEQSFWNDMQRDIMDMAGNSYFKVPLAPDRRTFDLPPLPQQVQPGQAALPKFGFQTSEQEKFWGDVLTRAEARLKEDPRDATAQAARNNAIRYQALVNVRGNLLRAQFGELDPGVRNLNAPATGYGPEAAQAYTMAENSGISNVYGVPLADPTQLAARFYHLAPDQQSYLQSFYGSRPDTPISSQEFGRRMREVTPVGVRAGTRIGYG
jgi:hypothetical protein